LAISGAVSSASGEAKAPAAHGGDDLTQSAVIRENEFDGFTQKILGY
jgi:hypothetical protein